MSVPFAHLHCHTDCSWLDGVGRATEYAELAARAGHTHLACTDHGGLHGLPMFRKACLDRGIKPVFGCELYVNDEREKTAEIKKQARAEKVDKDAIDPTFTDNHLVVFAETDEGWRNLLRINDDAVRNGYYYKPRTTHDFVLEHAEGLWATTACMGSQFGRLAARGERKRLERLLGKFRDAFGHRFFVEVHINEIEAQKAINGTLIELADELRIPCVLTSDVHYACAVDAARQDEMIAVSRHTSLRDPDAFKLEARHLYFSSAQDAFDMQRRFGFGYDKRWFRQIAERAAAIAASCDADIYPRDGKLRPPKAIDNAGEVIIDGGRRLASIAAKGLREKFPDGVPAEYVARLKHELAVIEKLGLADFYLVTLDIVEECRRRGVFVWARGSGCASLVAAAAKITPIDPVRFGLLFERFIDPDRPNAPDFDLDIDSSRRDEIAEWMQRKYGGEKGDRVARISSISTFGIRAAVRDVFFAHGVNKQDSFAIADLSDHLPAGTEDQLASASIADRERVLDEAVEAFRGVAPARLGPKVEEHANVLRAALTLVGRARNRQKHAAGFVVLPEPIVNLIPIDRIGSGKEAIIATAWDEGQAFQAISPTGAMKVDLLGLETVGVVARAAAAASARHGRDVLAEIDAWSMDFENDDVRREYRKGQGLGLHQLASSDGNLARFVARMKPVDVFDIVAAVAIYRPGALSFMDEYLSRARGEVPDSPHPVYEEITRETRGVIVYQEQVMALLHRLGNIPLRAAYKIIKFISKKDLAEIQKSKADFFSGCKANGIDEATAKELWAVVEKFAGYGFNKAHAASYGVLSWITAYLRAKYPAEFWFGWLVAVENKSDANKGERKIEAYLRAASRDVRLIGPVVGHSTSTWTVTKKGALLAPLSLVRGVGDSCADEIARAHRSKPFVTLREFLAWADDHRRVANSKAVLAMAQAGAFRKMNVTQATATDIVSAWAGLSTTKKNGTRTEQVYRLLETDPKKVLLTVEDDIVAMNLERQALGFSFWRDPWTVNNRIGKCEQLIEMNRAVPDDEKRVRGRRRPMLISGIRETKDKRGRRMAFLQARGMSGKAIRVVVFSGAWGEARAKVGVDRIFLISGEYDREGAYLVSNADSFLDVDRIRVAEKGSGA